MNEFQKLNWDSTSNSSYLEKQACSFIPDDVLLDSYIYQHLKKHLPSQKKTKIAVLNNEINFLPGKKYVPNFQRTSILSKEQQEHCLNAMKILTCNKNLSQLKPTEAYSLQQFEKMKTKISIENEAFNTYVKKSWEKDRFFIGKLQNNLYRYAWMCYKKKFSRYLHYGDFYKEQNLISMTYNEEDNATVEVTCIQNLLELGTLARFSQPSLKFECRLKGQSLPSITSNIQSNSKLPVSEDQHINELFKSSEIDIVISSSGLTRLLDSSDIKSHWMIPVRIELITKDKEGKNPPKKVVFIDKPLVQKQPDPLELKYYSMKRLIKTNLCQYEAFRYEKQDTYPDEKIANLNKKLTELEEKMNDIDCLRLNKEKHDQKTPEELENQEADEEPLWKKKKGNGKADIIHHNVNYRLWKFKNTVNNSNLMKNQVKNTELNVLVRSKLDACEISNSGALQPVIMKPKIELQLQYGANIPTKSELSREWTSLFFRPFSTLYRVRMHWNTAEVVSVENCTLQKVMSEANSLYQYNPYLGLGILNNIFNKLVELECGNYFLVHLPKYESFVGVWKECDGSSVGAMNMKTEFKHCEFKTELNRNWIPIDLSYILPIHEYDKRPPGCFTAVNKYKKFNKKGKPGIQKKKATPKQQEIDAKNKVPNKLNT